MLTTVRRELYESLGATRNQNLIQIYSTPPPLGSQLAAWSDIAKQYTYLQVARTVVVPISVPAVIPADYVRLAANRQHVLSVKERIQHVGSSNQDILVLASSTRWFQCCGQRSRTERVARCAICIQE